MAEDKGTVYMGIAANINTGKHENVVKRQIGKIWHWGKWAYPKKGKKQSRHINHESIFRKRSHELRKGLVVSFKKNLCQWCGRIEVEDPICPVICAFKQPWLIRREKLKENHNWAMSSRVILQGFWVWSL